MLYTESAQLWFNIRSFVPQLVLSQLKQLIVAPNSMRIKRGKHYKRIVRFYVLNYGFAPPFKVLIDGNFLLQCVKIQQDAKEMLSRVLGGVVHIDIRFPPCVSP